MTQRKAKSICTWLLAGFCLGVGIIIGYIAAHFTWQHILIGFFAFIGFCVLAVLTYAAVTDEPEETRSYPANWGFDKKFEE